MKVGVIVLFLLFGIGFVSAELYVSCNKNSDCTLALGDENYICEQSICQKEENEKPIFTLEPKSGDFSWNLIIIEEKKELCHENGCLFFAPEEKKDSGWERFLNFVLYL